MANLEKVNSENFNEVVLRSSYPVLVDFNATWCGPCKMLAPTLEELANEYKGKIKIVSLDIDEAGDIAGRYSVMSIPTLIIFKNGEPLNRSMGMQPKPKVKAQIDEAL